MSETNVTRRESSSGGAPVVVFLLLTFFGLPVVYCLSIGPAIWLIERTGMNPDFFEIIYTPLEWLHSNVALVRPLLDWYVELWR